MARIFKVDTVSITIQKTNPPTLLVTATGRAATPGWKHLDLVPLETTLSPDGILDLEFVGDPPTGIVPQVITAVTADYMTTADVEKIVGVQIHARTNTQSALRSISLPNLMDKTQFAPARAMFNRGNERQPTLTEGETIHFGETDPYEFPEKILSMGEQTADGSNPDESDVLMNAAPLTIVYAGPFGVRRR
ncbi:MAG: hypothetical protein ABIQ30_18085 [Devosia sp.]